MPKLFVDRDSDAVRKAIEERTFDPPQIQFPSDIEKMRELMEQNAKGAKRSTAIAIVGLIVGLLTLAATIIGIAVSLGWRP